MTKKDVADPIEGDELHKSIIKEYGENSIVGANAIIDEDVRIVPLSPKIDMIIGGGIPEGVWTTVTGASGAGKSTLALHYAAKCQRPEYGNREVYYLDIEGRLKKVNLRGIPGLNLDKFHVIRSHKKKILSGQEYLRIGETILKTIENVVLIVDSYSAICHSSELEGEVGMSTRGAGGYALVGQFCRQMCNVVPVMKSNVVGITHLMANIGSPYGGLTEKSGTAITYHADIRLKAKKITPWVVGDKTIGQSVTWQCLKSALGASCGEVEGWIRYGKGIDEVYELFTIASDIGLIKKSGTWYYIGEQKAQGGEGMYKLIMENPKIRLKLEDDLKQMLGTAV